MITSVPERGLYSMTGGLLPCVFSALSKRLALFCALATAANGFKPEQAPIDIRTNTMFCCAANRLTINSCDALGNTAPTA
jgi:hypothetical protein